MAVKSSQKTAKIKGATTAGNMAVFTAVPGQIEDGGAPSSGGGGGTVTATGTLTAGRLIKGNGTTDITVGDLTGDATTSGTMAITLATNVVTNAKAAQMAAHTIKGNNTGSTANAADLTVTQVTAELNAVVGDSGSGGTKGLVPAPGAGDAAAGKFLKADGTFAIPAGTATGTVTTSGSPASGNLTKFSGASAITNGDLSGDATTSGTLALTIANDAVTNAKAANMAQSTIKGRAVSAGTGDPTDLTATQATAILDVMVGDSGTGGTKGLVPAPASGDAAANKFLKADGTYVAPSGTGAPASSQYVTLANDSGLSAERVLTAGTGITITDGGANSTVTISATSGVGGGGTVLLEQHTASASASLAFTTWYSSSYDEYVIEFVGLIPATNAADFWLRMSTNGGSSYDSGANYGWSVFVWRAGGSAVTGAESGAAQIDLTSYDVSNTSTASLNGSIRLFSPASTALHKVTLGEMSFVSPTGGPFRVSIVNNGTYISTTAVNAFQVLCSSGNITSGIIRVYGVAK